LGQISVSYWRTSCSGSSHKLAGTAGVRQIIFQERYALSSKSLISPLLTSRVEIAGDIIHKMGYVAQNYEEELKGYKTGTSDHKKYEMPDGEILSVQEERIRYRSILNLSANISIYDTYPDVRKYFFSRRLLDQSPKGYMT